MELGGFMKGVFLWKYLTSAMIISALTACGGGGGIDSGSGNGSGSGGGTVVIGPSPSVPPSNSSDLIRYPYETVYGDVCLNSQPTPGCTFSRATGKRITVSADPNYDMQGYGSDDLWFVKFDSRGTAAVYDDLGRLQYNADITKFAGHVGGTTIGVGQTGLFWENVSNKTYWFGKNGVLYSANKFDSNFGEAINTKDADKEKVMNSKAFNSDINKSLIRAGAAKLQKQYGLSASKAVAVASALNSWAVMGAERGKITTGDMDRTFKAVFNVPFTEALAAFKDFQNGDVTGARELTHRSATALGLKPDQAQEFIKGMYKGAIEQMGFKTSDISW
jgi:hypothetical protein